MSRGLPRTVRPVTTRDRPGRNRAAATEAASCRPACRPAPWTGRAGGPVMVKPSSRLRRDVVAADGGGAVDHGVVECPVGTELAAVRAQEKQPRDGPAGDPCRPPRPVAGSSCARRRPALGVLPGQRGGVAQPVTARAATLIAARGRSRLAAFVLLAGIARGACLRRLPAASSSLTWPWGDNQVAAAGPVRTAAGIAHGVVSPSGSRWRP